MGPKSARTHIPEDEIHGDHLVEYSHKEPPVFLGHYWLEGEPVNIPRSAAVGDLTGIISIPYLIILMISAGPSTQPMRSNR